MEKPTLKRLGLGFIQHLMAAGILLAVAWILFHSFLTVLSMQGAKTYKIDPLHTDEIFENSEVYQEIFRTAVADVTKLVVIQEELETEGKFDPGKKIDVTEYAVSKGIGSPCAATAQYTLDDLIKWGKNGVEYTNRFMSMEDFLNYFGPVIDAANYALDENGQLYFEGFHSSRTEAGDAERSEGGSSKSAQELSKIENAFSNYTTEALQDMAFGYIMAEYPENISVSREDDGSLNVFIPLLVCRYETADGERQLLSCADNWVDYMKLQENLAAAIQSLFAGYQQYQSCNDLYREGNTNLKYMIRMMQGEEKITFTNVSELEHAEDSEVTEYFSEYRRYLIYYPDNLEFTGNTVLSEDEVHQYIREYEYAYPESTHLWVGVDNTYSVPGDAFYNARTAFDRIVPNIGFVVAVIIFMGVVWIGIWFYLSATAGLAKDAEGSKVKYINSIDKIWLELWLGLCAAAGGGMVYGFYRLRQIAESVTAYSADTGIVQNLKEYGSFGFYGMAVSLSVCVLWYSLVRRIRYGKAWKTTFLYWLYICCRRLGSFVLRHKNSAVRTFLPYNLFLFLNLSGILCVYVLREKTHWMLLMILAVAVFDVIVGMVLFRHNGEQNEIVEGILRIRNGEVDFKLDTERLHGANREMADAVNNIGEGIRKAVRTSMKDEQMKTDLITNVSHDIKTPLTSIINYVDLLKRQHIEEEPAKSYIEVLESKAQRLKQLTDDLVEASKISSGNIVLNKEKLNLTELLNQSIGEFSEKLEEKKLELIFSESELTANVYADSRRMWRVMENLFHNICKYAMEGTRVYLDLDVQEGEIQVSLKNISRNRMNMKPDELTERFIRGDESRSAEGSGLGLSIAKSLVTLQGGEFTIYLDGDLFKVAMVFPEYQEETENEDS